VQYPQEARKYLNKMPAKRSRTLRQSGSSGSSLLALLGILFLASISWASGARDHRRQTNLEAKVGSHVVFNCYIDFPFDAPIPYLVHWSKDVRYWEKR